MGLFKAIKGLLYKDSKCTDNQNDSNDLLAVNRLIIIITALYHFIIFGVLVCSNGLIPATVAGVSGILYALVLMLTYYFNHEKSMFTLVAVSCISNTVLSVQWGGELHFQHFILLLIPILFASIALSVKTKFISSIGLVTLVIVIEHYILHSDPIFVLDELPEHFIIVFSSFAYAVYLTIISYYFCMKFTQAEHKVYVYNRQLKKMASLDPLTGLDRKSVV